MIKIHVLYEYGVDRRPFGSASIRLLRPLSYLHAAAGIPESNSNSRHLGSRLDHDWNGHIPGALSWGHELKPADVVIVQRAWRPDISADLACELVQRIRNQGACFIWEADDNLLDLVIDVPGRHPIRTDAKMAIRHFARAADGIIVSTEHLRERLMMFNRNIMVVPNAIDERLFASRQNRLRIPYRKEPRTIGYMGTMTHDADLMMILQPLRETLRKFQNRIEFQIVGGLANRSLLHALQGLPHRILDFDGADEYPAFMRWMAENISWDVALAPLEDTTFTRCKSDLKFLDYSALGIPGIFSRVPPYENTVRHRETGYLTDNTPDAWVEAMATLLTNHELRSRIASDSHAYVHSQRTLRQRAHTWQDAILTIWKS